MGRPRSTTVSISHEPGRPKPYRCRFMERTATGWRKNGDNSFATLERALEFKREFDDEQRRIAEEERASGRSAAPVSAPPARREAPAPVSTELLDVASAPKGSLTFEQFTRSWLATIVTDLKPSTYRSYEQVMRCHVWPVIGRVKLSKDTFTTGTLVVLNATLKKNEVGWGTRTVTLRACSAALGWAVLYGHLPANPAARLVGKLRPRDEGYEEPVPSPLSAAQGEAFLFWVLHGTPGAVGKRVGNRLYRVRAGRGYPELYEFFLFLLRTGVRLGEACGVRWCDLDLELRVAHLQWNNSPSAKLLKRKKEDVMLKTGKQRDVYLSRQLVEALRELLTRRQEQALAEGRPWSDTDWVFRSPRGRARLRASNNAVVEAVAKGMQALGIAHKGHTIHSLRDTFATTHLMQSTGKLPWVSKMLGHANPEITLRRYTAFVAQGDSGQRYADDIDTTVGSGTDAQAEEKGRQL